MMSLSAIFKSGSGVDSKSIKRASAVVWGIPAVDFFFNNFKLVLKVQMRITHDNLPSTTNPTNPVFRSNYCCS